MSYSSDFCMAVAFMIFIMELQRNGGRSAAIAENRNLPLNHLRQSYVFSKKKYEFLHFTLINFKYFTIQPKKSVQCKCIKMIQKCITQREMAKKNSAVAAVSPPFLRSSRINIIKATAIPKLTAVTHFLAEFLR